MFLQNVFDTGNHEVHERLRRINNAVRVSHLDAKALKKLLINGVEKLLLLAVIGKMLGGIFQRAVKVLQALAEIVAAEYLGIEGGDDFFNLLRDNVALHEISGGKNFAHDALGEDVLDDHFLDGLDGNVRIKRATAQRIKIIKRGDEFYSLCRGSLNPNI